MDPVCMILPSAVFVSGQVGAHDEDGLYSLIVVGMIQSSSAHDALSAGGKAAASSSTASTKTPDSTGPSAAWTPAAILLAEESQAGCLAWARSIAAATQVPVFDCESAAAGGARGSGDEGDPGK